MLRQSTDTRVNADRPCETALIDVHCATACEKQQRTRPATKRTDEEAFTNRRQVDHDNNEPSEADHPYRTTELAKVRLPSKRQGCGGDSNGDGYNVQRSVARPESTSSTGRYCITLVFLSRSFAQSKPRSQHRVSECLVSALKWSIAQAQLARRCIGGQLSARQATKRSATRLEQQLGAMPATRTPRTHEACRNAKCSLHIAWPSHVDFAARRRCSSVSATDFFVLCSAEILDHRIHQVANHHTDSPQTSPRVKSEVTGATA